MHILQKLLVECRDQMGADFSIRSYSGRGMYNETCLAICGDNINLADIFYTIGRMDEEEKICPHELGGMRSDSMGLGMVYYWPRIPYKKVTNNAEYNAAKLEGIKAYTDSDGNNDDCPYDSEDNQYQFDGWVDGWNEAYEAAHNKD